VNEDDLRLRYDELVPRLERLGANLRDALSQLLAEAGVDTLTITYRVKALHSLRDKAARKKYNDPLSEAPDLCGVRVIAFYPTDLIQIEHIILSEFQVDEAVDKSDELGSNRFGYRSNHYIIKLKQEWTGAPNYRGLNEMRAEIQVRTNLMHAWANLSHALSYKSPEQVPEEFQRRIYQLSALFELADQEFDRLRKEKLDYQRAVRKAADSPTHEPFAIGQPLNVDSLQAFLDVHAPDRSRSASDTEYLLSEMQEVGATLADLDAGFKLMQPYILEDEVAFGGDGTTYVWSQGGLARHVLDCTLEPYWNARQQEPADRFSKIPERRRRLLRRV
jgi:putative GTP pyrophosphokinase